MKLQAVALVLALGGCHQIFSFESASTDARPTIDQLPMGEALPADGLRPGRDGATSRDRGASPVDVVARVEGGSASGDGPTAADMDVPPDSEAAADASAPSDSVPAAADGQLGDGGCYDPPAACRDASAWTLSSGPCSKYVCEMECNNRAITCESPVSSGGPTTCTCYLCGVEIPPAITPVGYADAAMSTALSQGFCSP